MRHKKKGILSKINPEGSVKAGKRSPFIMWTGITLLVFLFIYFAIITFSNLNTTPQPVPAQPAPAIEQ